MVHVSVYLCVCVRYFCAPRDACLCCNVSAAKASTVGFKQVSVCCSIVRGCPTATCQCQYGVLQLLQASISLLTVLLWLSVDPL